MSVPSLSPLSVCRLNAINSNILSFLFSVCRFGEGYILTIRIKGDLPDLNPMKAFIQERFPEAMLKVRGKILELFNYYVQQLQTCICYHILIRNLKECPGKWVHSHLNYLSWMS